MESSALQAPVRLRRWGLDTLVSDFPERIYP